MDCRKNRARLILEYLGGFLMLLMRNGKSVRTVELVLENCEGIVVPACVVELLTIEQNKENDICKFKLVMDSQAEGLTEIMMNLYNSYGCMYRLQQSKDITHIFINYNDETKEEFSVSWVGDDYTNELQDVYHKNGKFIVEIKEEKELYNIYIEKGLLMEYINDVKTNIMKKDSKSESDIGVLNIMSRLSLDIKSGKFDKIL